MFILPKKGCTRMRCRNWIVEWIQGSSVRREELTSPLYEFLIVDHRLKKKEVCLFLDLNRERKRIVCQGRYHDHEDVYPLHFGCADPCKFPKLGKLDCNLWMRKLCMHTPIALAQIKFLSGFVWGFLDWSHARSSMLSWKDGSAVSRVLTTLREDLGLILSIYLVAHNFPSLIPVPGDPAAASFCFHGHQASLRSTFTYVQAKCSYIK